MDTNTLKEKLQNITNEVYLLRIKEILKEKKDEILYKNVFLNRKQAVEKILSMLGEEKEEVSEVYFHFVDLEKKSRGHYQVVLKISFVIPTFMLVNKKNSETIKIPINQIKTLEISILEFYTTEFFI
jgi:hypothetical protein